MTMTNKLRGQTTVEIGDNTFDVLLNMNAFRLLCQDRKIELAELDQFVNSSPLEFVPTVVFWGIMNAADFKGASRPEISFDHLAAVVCADLDQFNELSEVIGSSIGAGVEGDNSGN